MREPDAEYISAKLWALRLVGRDGMARASYVAASG